MHTAVLKDPKSPPTLHIRASPLDFGHLLAFTVWQRVDLDSGTLRGQHDEPARRALGGRRYWTWRRRRRWRRWKFSPGERACLPNQRYEGMRSLVAQGNK